MKLSDSDISKIIQNWCRTNPEVSQFVYDRFGEEAVSIENTIDILSKVTWVESDYRVKISDSQSHLEWEDVFEDPYNADISEILNKEEFDKCAIDHDRGECCWVTGFYPAKTIFEHEIRVEVILSPDQNKVIILGMSAD